MAIETRLFGARFALAASTTAVFPPSDTWPVGLSDGVPVRATEERGAVFLLLDHRDATDGSCSPARIELWMPLAGGEARAAGLFVIAEAHSPTNRPAPRPATLTALAELLSEPTPTRLTAPVGG